MKQFILVLGGARSGKSSYAVDLAKKLKKRTVFIATATVSDSEMEKRIKLHKKVRPRQWKLIEESKDISLILPKLKGKYGVVLIDCLGLLISNLLADNLEDKKIEMRIKKLISTILKLKVTTILVSNEVGMGIVPISPLARRFRDLVGLSNQMIAKNADKVIFMQAGIPLIIKRGKKDAKIKKNNRGD
ncbi:MAG: bifunctional adenosylcobinamide kinase/adenosylcobinamide-phosphate guanylyltransferase [Candidatus Omnitrophica bacterium]|nr:bifunctional adenosylcobinamide kinase/adenosylcobinamide-phosphate guanylyltransferase [Candidatus Omnitrophota bacterium]